MVKKLKKLNFKVKSHSCFKLIQNIIICLSFFWSGQRDLNPRPSAPQTDALPSCAMARFNNLEYKRLNLLYNQYHYGDIFI